MTREYQVGNIEVTEELIYVITLDGLPMVHQHDLSGVHYYVTYEDALNGMKRAPHPARLWRAKLRTTFERGPWLPLIVDEADLTDPDD